MTFEEIALTCPWSEMMDIVGRKKTLICRGTWDECVEPLECRKKNCAPYFWLGCILSLGAPRAKPTKQPKEESNDQNKDE